MTNGNFILCCNGPMIVTRCRLTEHTNIVTDFICSQVIEVLLIAMKLYFNDKLSVHHKYVVFSDGSIGGVCSDRHYNSISCSDLSRGQNHKYNLSSLLKIQPFFFAQKKKRERKRKAFIYIYIIVMTCRKPDSCHISQIYKVEFSIIFSNICFLYRHLRLQYFISKLWM